MGLFLSAMITAILWGISTPKLILAYLDPGSGSYFLQLLIASLMGGLFALGVFRKKVIEYFKRIFSSKSNDEDE
jgi:hypothetical protein